MTDSDSIDTNTTRVSRRKTLKVMGAGTGTAALLGIGSLGYRNILGNESGTNTWRQFGNGPTNPHTTPAPAPRNLTERWRFRSGREFGNPPTVVDGTIYLGGRNLYALDAETGDTRWSADVNASTPAVVDGILYANSAAVDPATGEKLFEYDKEGPTPIPPTVKDGTVYIGGRDPDPNHGLVYAIDAETGEQHWKYEIELKYGHVNRSVAVADGVVYATHRHNSGGVHAIDAETGEKRWEYDTKYRAVASPTVKDGTVYIGRQRSGYFDLDPKMFALDAKTGEKRWDFVPNPRRHILYAAAATDDTIYFGTSGKKLREDDSVIALNATTGEKRWQTKTGTVPGTPVFARGKIYANGWSNDDRVVGRENEEEPHKRMYVLDAGTGEILETFRMLTQNDPPGPETEDTVGPISTQVLVDGSIYLGTTNGLIAVEGDTPGRSG